MQSIKVSPHQPFSSSNLILYISMNVALKAEQLLLRHYWKLSFLSYRASPRDKIRSELARFCTKLTISNQVVWYKCWSSRLIFRAWWRDVSPQLERDGNWDQRLRSSFPLTRKIWTKGGMVWMVYLFEDKGIQTKILTNLVLEIQACIMKWKQQ